MRQNGQSDANWHRKRQELVFPECPPAVSMRPSCCRGDAAQSG